MPKPMSAPRRRDSNKTASGKPGAVHLGMDRLLKSNTSKTRTHSLFRQGCMLYELIPTMPEHRLAPLMQKFAEAVAGSGFMPAAIVASK
jgi:hypothetical protein